MTTLQVRTDENLKKRARKILKALGIDLSSAVNMYLRQIVITESIPFPVRTANGFTPEQEQQMIQEIEEAMRSGKRYHSLKEMHRDIIAGND